MSQSPEAGWIRCQYFGFWDVPRALMITHQGRSFLLDSPFEDEADEYRPSYIVWELEATSQELCDTLPRPELESRRRRQRRDLPVQALRFAPNRERSNGRYYALLQIVDPESFAITTGE